MTEKQKELLSEAYDLEAMSNVLKTNLSRAYRNGDGVHAQDVARCTEMHVRAVRLQELAEGME